MSSQYSKEELTTKSQDWLIRKIGSLEHNQETNQRLLEELERRGLQTPQLPKYPVYPPNKKLRILHYIVWVTVLLVIPPIVSIPIVAVLIIYYYLTGDKVARYPFTKEQKTALENGAKDGVTELMIIAASGDIERAADLIAFGFDVNAKTKSDLTPLMFAAKSQQIAMCHFLIENGGDITIVSKAGKRASDFAKETGNPIACLN